MMNDGKAEISLSLSPNLSLLKLELLSKRHYLKNKIIPEAWPSQLLKENPPERTTGENYKIVPRF